MSTIRITSSDYDLTTYGVTCDYGTAVKVYASSAVEAHVWLALQEGPRLIKGAQLGKAHAHLSPDQALAVILRLGAWLADEGLAVVTIEDRREAAKEE